MVGKVKLLALVAGLGMAASAFGQTAPGETVYGITADNNLFSFNSATPNTIATGVYVTGLQNNEFIQAIDFRPLNGQLYALGSTNRVYTLNLTSGAATAVGAPFTPALNGTAFGLDFNNMADRIRVHSNSNQNLRLLPDTGAIASVDADLFYAAGDSGAGLDPNVVATAYTNLDNDPATGTTLYSIDSVRDTLNIHTVGGPGFASMTTVGTLRSAAGATIPFGDFAGFDIGASGTAYVSWNNSNTLFGTVDLATGIVSTTGTIGGGIPVRDFAVRLPPVPEPTSLGLAAVAAVGMLVRRRK